MPRLHGLGADLALKLRRHRVLALHLLFMGIELLLHEAPDHVYEHALLVAQCEIHETRPYIPASLNCGAGPLPLPSTHGIVSYGWTGGGEGWCDYNNNGPTYPASV